MAQVTLAQLGRRDVVALWDLLDRDVVANVFLRSELRQAPPSGAWWGVLRGGVVSAAALGGPLVVPCIPDLEDAAPLAEAVQRQPQMVRMLVGPREAVLALDAHLGARRRPRQLRDPQPMMVCDRGSLLAPEQRTGVRRGTRSDLSTLVVAAAAMHREEMGVDPLAVDSAAWWQRMTYLVDMQRSWLWVENGEIIFKTELSAWTPECAQLQGVYVAPGHRNRGIGRAGLAAVMRDLFHEVPVCSLYVNHYNDIAQRLYRGLGFREQGAYTTIIY